ncbi:MAG: peptide chain release factor 1 [Candidatus Omnitrophica bacterium]|nr:peptide chain release factor 1 [Candidatus Omnitrophota bacterium]MDD5512777.1 peptide chain release factor 1 [Candidatus Omnitrophota bacterium]
MFEQLEKFEKRYLELEELLASPEVLANKEICNRYAKELADLREPVSLFRDYKKVSQEAEELRMISGQKHDLEFLDLARKELKELESKKSELESRLKIILAPEDTDLGRDIIVEIRQGTGGNEAGLFAADLYRMYTKYAANKGWSVELMSASTNDSGGFKDVAFSVKGKEAYKRLKFESGVHRVQRVPVTEAQGRIHTSTATVAVLVEPQELDLAIDAKDLRIDTYRSSGPGGQHMQKTDSAVRITHIPTGTVVACQDERSQIKNKAKAMRILRARILDNRQQEEMKRFSQERKSQIGTGDRSEKIRTYNFPDRRVTDHRINFTSHRLEAVLEGNMDELSDALIKAAQEKKNE